MPRHKKMLLGLLLGATMGLAAHGLAGDSPLLSHFVAYVVEPVGKVFIRLLLMLSVPVIFSALVIGVCDLDFRQMGRMGLRMIGYTVAVSAVATAIGLVLVNLLRPGTGVSMAIRDQARPLLQTAPRPPGGSMVDTIIAIVPTNPIQAAATGDIIAFIFFALMFGVGLALVKNEATATLKRAVQGLLDISMRLIDLVLGLAPYGVAALLFTSTARLGWGVLTQLAAYVGVVLLGLAVQFFGVYSFTVRWLGGISPLVFFRETRLALVTAFSTASSSATLPTALQVAENNLRLPAHVSRFVLTAGSTMNQNGTALFEGVTVLFLAQVYGVELGLSQQILVMGLSVLAGIGTAGVPAGSLPAIAIILTTVGIPAEGIGLVLGVDRLLDMCRTTVNVAGDLAAAVFVARGERPTPAGTTAGVDDPDGPPSPSAVR